MRKLCPNLERDDALDTVLEVPIPEEMFSGGGRGGVRVQQPLRRWQEQRLRAQARIRRLRHFPVFQFLSRPLQCWTLSLSLPCGIRLIARLVYGLNGGLNCLLGRVLGKGWD